MEDSGIATRWDVITGGEKFSHHQGLSQRAARSLRSQSDWFDIPGQQRENASGCSSMKISW
jgi:hypothetical protein